VLRFGYSRAHDQHISFYSLPLLFELLALWLALPVSQLSILAEIAVSSLPYEYQLVKAVELEDYQAPTERLAFFAIYCGLLVVRCVLQESIWKPLLSGFILDISQ
jgi:hypothetical protein